MSPRSSAGKTPTFDEAKADLEKKLLKERASGAIFELHDKIEDQLAAGAKLSEIADKLKLNYQVIDQVDRTGRKPDGSTVTLPAQTQVLNAVFASDVGVDNDPIDAKDEGVIWYEVLGIVPEQLKPFDQVKDEVAKDWRDEEERTKVAKYAQELVNSLVGGKTLEEVANDLNVQVLTSDPLKRERRGRLHSACGGRAGLHSAGRRLRLGALRHRRRPHRVQGRQGHAASTARREGSSAAQSPD